MRPSSQPHNPPVDRELLAELGELSTEDLCRRYERQVRELSSLQARVGQSRTARSRVARCLAERLDRERRAGGPAAVEADGIAYRPHADLAGVDRVPVGGRAYH